MEAGAGSRRLSGPHYPLRVRAGLKERLGAVIGCLVFLVPTIWMCVVVVTQVDDLWTTIGGLVLFGGLGAGAVWFGGYVWTFKTIFDPTGVTAETMWGARRFERAHLHGWRWGAAGSEIVTVELYKESSPRPFQVLVPKANEPTIAAWFEGAQNLESAEVTQSITEIEGDATLGATREERIKSADAETLLLKRAYWLFLALTIWVWVFPRPYYLAVGIAIAAPVLILLVTYLRRDRLRLWPGANKFRASTGELVVLCVGAAIIRAINDWRILDWLTLILAVLIAGTTIAIVLLIVSGERFARRDRVIGAVLVALAYVYGAIVPLNMWLDREPPQTVRGAVLELPPEQVVIDAPAPFSGRISEEISRDLSERLTIGGPICIDLYRGAFRIRSYEMRVCATTEGAFSSE